MDWYLTVSLVLIGVGVAALTGEFAAPTGGLLVVAAVAAFVAGVGVILLYGSRTEAAVALVGLCVGIPAMTYVAMSGYRRLALKSALTAPGAAGPQPIDFGSNLALLKGRTGTAASPLRPAGVAVIDDRRVDAMSEGPFIDAGTPVLCVGVRGAAVVVRPAEAARPLSDMSLDELT